MNRIDKIKEEIQKLCVERSSIDESIRLDAEEKFENSGGCKTCRGRGWVVVWDTMDSTSGCYHESARCSVESCTRESRKNSGLSPRNNKYDSFHHCSQWLIENHTTPDQVEKCLYLDTEKALRESELRVEEARWAVSKGKVVKVINAGRGRKDRRVPVGTEGLVERRFSNSWGTTKLIVIDKDGTKWWPKLNQVVVIDPEPDTSLWENIKNEELNEKGYPLIATVKKATSKALLVFTTRGSEFWVPRSQINFEGKIKAGEVHSLMIPMWLAKQKDLIKE